MSIQRACTVMSFLVLVGFISISQGKASERPNIILIMSDDMGFSDIGCYGGEIQTPVLDGLAKNGLRFSQFYNMGRCCPTRASLLTGLYPHQAGVGHMTGDYKLPSYRGNLNKSSQTIAEVLRPAGYRTYMSGKWHVTRHTGPQGPKHTWPLQRGFDRFYGTIIGAGSFYDPTTLCRDNTYITPVNDKEYNPKTFYYTDAINDNAIRYIKDHYKDHSTKPFFLYVSHTAAHWPMHALPEDIKKYKGKYDGGYVATHQARVKKLKQLGLLKENWDVAPLVGKWAKVKNKKREAMMMEVYAAMVDRMDQGIGNIVEELKKQKVFDNTLIFFLQDNGGCAESLGWAPMKPGVKYKPWGPDVLQPKIWPPMQTRDGRVVRTGKDVLPGPEDTYLAYDRNWANVSNTPFREYKHWVHEGGIATPLIAHWPKGIQGKNRWAHVPSHLIDIQATCVDIAKAAYPTEIEGTKITPLEGVSLNSIFKSEKLKRQQAIFWEHEGNRAVRKGKWKLVAKHRRPWELYDMAADRTEMHNLAKDKPDLVKELVQEYEAWTKRCGVVPFGSWNKKRK